MYFASLHVYLTNRLLFCILALTTFVYLLSGRLTPTFSRGRLARRRLPSCLIIGARKGGTRAMLQFLSLHPKIRIVPQELHYFDDNATYNKGIEWYRSQMPFTDQPDIVVVEKTPAYFVSTVAPERVRLLDPSMKLILVVRDPVIRTVSDYTQVMHSKLSKGKPVAGFERSVFDSTGMVRACYKPIINSLYVIHLRRWLAYFPASQVHIADGDRLISQPIIELQAAERFLQLEPKISADQLYFNRTKGFYCYHHPSQGNICLGNTKGRLHVKISSSTRARLKTFFHKYNQLFYACANRTFTW
ncbi:heparan sulfate glucosamine 3 O sulfotransferase [Trichuris trichiura]|uniref:Heparan sulfate glucosamine 3 O sulfotransferase n=1 Tax=Trichuris trichiura TaxID=36087 RepID=A0A077Z9M9_TRITR|nr:heparan sulfate glucosamine 3 O sulfotransferase [Trichuris trichiura]